MNEEQARDLISEALQHFPRSLNSLLEAGTIQVAPPSSGLKEALCRRHGRKVYVTPDAVARSKGGALHEEILHFFDHALGDEGKNLSEGFTSRPSLQSFADKHKLMFEQRSRTGLFVDDYSSRNPREWLAQGLRYYLTSPAYLKAVDPELYTFIEDHWLNEKFWSEHL